MKAYGNKGFKPVGETASLLPGTYYLEKVDDEHRRAYAVKQA
jgi:hydroxymethylglutaryl-CoA synthase